MEFQECRLVRHPVWANWYDGEGLVGVVFVRIAIDGAMKSLPRAFIRTTHEVTTMVSTHR